MQGTNVAFSLSEVLKRKLVFVSGKGGVGKTAISQALALAFSQEAAGKGAKAGPRTLWATFQDPTRPPGELVKLSPTLWHLNCDATASFEEYASRKIGVALLSRIFLQNKVIRYLSKAAPGIHELVLLGKVWSERLNFDHVIVDMPSTGYGITMFQATANFGHLFRHSPIQRDTQAMLASFNNPAETGQLILSIPEETPLIEGLELREMLLRMFPHNPPALLLNKKFPAIRAAHGSSENPDEWPTPFANSVSDYSWRRSAVEQHNLRLWRETKLPFKEIRFLPPTASDRPEAMVALLAEEMRSGGLL